MSTPLRVLLIEDSEDDALLTVRALQRGGYTPTWQRVETAETLRAALAQEEWDLILCDWVMPRFSAPAALQLIQDAATDAPTIIVSGEGGVDCVNEPEGGASFRIYLPRGGVVSEARANTRPLPAAAPPAVRGTVLIAEDEANLRLLLREALEECGCTVHTAGSADEALRLAAGLERPIDLLVTDMVMPGASAHVLAQQLLERYPAMRVLCISGYPPGTVDLSDIPGARFLSKPFDLDGLLSTVSELLAR